MLIRRFLGSWRKAASLNSIPQHGTRQFRTFAPSPSHCMRPLNSASFSIRTFCRSRKTGTDTKNENDEPIVVNSFSSFKKEWTRKMALHKKTKEQPSESNESNEAPKKKQWKITKLAKEHGKGFIIYYTGVWAGSGLLIFACLELGFLGENAATTAFEAMYLDRLFDLKNINASSGNVVLAVAINEVLEVFKFPFCVWSYSTYQKWQKQRKPVPKEPETLSSKNKYDKYM